MQKETTLRNASDLLMQCLENEGIEYIFGVPGEENLVFLEALRKSKINLVVTRDEQSAVFMASTFGRLTGKVGVAISTLGPGATNLVTGVAYAQLGGMPLLVITGQKPIKKSKQGKFQIINAVRMMEPITKYTTTLESPYRIPSVVRQAVKLAEAERPGAVHIELPSDIAGEEVGGALVPIVAEKVRRPAPDPKVINEALAIIESAKSPIIITASGANRKLIRKQLLYFIQKTGIPFVSTQMGKGVEDEHSPLYIGTTAISSGDFVHQALAKADVVIMLGHDIGEKPPIVLTPKTHKVIHINFSPADIDDVYVPTREIVGDVSHALWLLAEKIKVSPNWDFKYFFKVRDALRKSIEKTERDERFPLHPARIIHDVYESLPKDGVLTFDNGMYKLWFARNYRASMQNSMLLDNAFATMGAGLPTGIATKILNPDKKVLVIAGDGGFMMNVAELETAHRLNIDLTVLILNDNGFGMIRWFQDNMQVPSFGLRFGNPDFVKLAESFGAKGYRVKKTEDLPKILNKALGSKGVNIIDCPIDYSVNVKEFGADLQKEISKL